MDFTSTPLEQLGVQAHGHYKVAEKHKDKADQQYKSAGLYLKEAQDRIKLRKDINFAEFLLKHCPIGKSRAYEVIAIADGRKTVEETNQRHTERHAREREERAAGQSAMSERSEDQPEEPNVFNERHAQPNPPTPEQSFHQDALDAHEVLLRDVINKVRAMNSTQLIQLKEYLPVVLH